MNTKYNKIAELGTKIGVLTLTTFVLVSLFVVSPVFAEEMGENTTNTAKPTVGENSPNKEVLRAKVEDKKLENETKKIERVKTAADKQLDQRIESLNKLKERVAILKNVNDTDKATINTVIGNVISDLNELRNVIDTATSTEVVKSARETITKNYRVYVLVMPQLSIIASADRMITMVSMLNIVSSKLESRLMQVATSSTEITSANLATANKALVDLKAKILQAQTDAQAAVALVAPLVPDQGDKTVAEANLKVMKEARAKIKSAQTNLVTAKKDAETITKILGKEKRMQKTATSTDSEKTKKENDLR
jgi:hypothetical protein